MYEILFHILGLALLEIIFYFYYVGPMETHVFENSINSALRSIVEKPSYEERQVIKNTLNNNPILKIILGNNTNYENDIYNQYKDSMEKRDLYNYILYNECIKYWLISFFILLFLLAVIKLITYYLKRNKLFCYRLSTNNESGIEMTNINNVITYDDINNTRDDELQNMGINDSSSTNFRNDRIKKKFDRTKIIKYIFYYIFSFGGILTFEYFFFNYVILKYKITSNIEIEYLLFKNIDKYY